MNSLQSIKRFGWFGAFVFLASLAPSAWGFALLGPAANGGDAWQLPAIGYVQNTYGEVGLPGGLDELGEIGDPKNIGEGYRRNTPVMYYTYSPAFLNYFGSNGVAAVDSAFAIMNNAMTNNALGTLDGYSTNLSEFPPESLHVNYEAQSLALTDLKSVTLHLLCEQLGLAEPERYTWTLAERVIISPPGCPLGAEYLVVQRNFGITPSAPNQLQYSAYVNDTLYSYEIFEDCGVGAPPDAETIPFSVDPSADTYTAVAANTGDGLGLGGYYTSLTRDDVAGLRYLLTTNNYATEDVAPGALQITTNANSGEILLVSSDLNALLASSQNLPAATLNLLFPGVVSVPGNPPYYYTEVVTTNVTLTINPNQVDAPYGFGVLQETVTLVTNFQQVFLNSFANVITNGNLTNTPNVTVAPGITLAYSTNTVVSYQVTAPGLVVGQPGEPYGYASVVTNMTTSTVTLNEPSGEYLVVPPGYCGFNILEEIPLPTVYTTNIIASATNANAFVDTVAVVTSFTPHEFLVQPIVCTETAPTPGLFQGVGKVTFVRADYDSLLSQLFNPVTNNYSMVLASNSQLVVENYQRIVTAPDIVLSGDNQIAGNTFDGTVTRNINYDQAHIFPGLAGPGTIVPPTTFEYNIIGDAFENFYVVLNTNIFLSEESQLQAVQWASFDASTNPPVLYPNGNSIQNLQSQILVQVLPPPPILPDDATNGIPYSPSSGSGFVYTNSAGTVYVNQFSASGGAFNYTPAPTWSLVPGLGNLPPGLSLSSNGVISGTPTQSGTYDFTIQMTDNIGRSVSWYYTLIIH